MTRSEPVQRVYLDHAATTPLNADVLAAMQPYLTGLVGNPSSLHAAGRLARAALDDARDRVAHVLGAAPDEVVFTSGGTEADNLAVWGAARAQRAGRRHVIVSAIEHHAVLLAAQSLRREGFDVEELPVDGHGIVSAERLTAMLRPDTALVSVGLANNEIGSVQDIPTLAAAAHAAGAVFHTDAVQGAGQLDINVDSVAVDLLSLSGHKMYGPRGVGALYVRAGTPLEPVSAGGAQELDRRAGTEDVAGIVGLAAALTRAGEERDRRQAHYRRCTDVLIDGVLAGVPDARLTGHPSQRAPSIASFAFPNVDAESLVINLDLAGIDASTGAACTSGSVEPSHVMAALDLPEAFTRGALRCSVGVDTRLDEAHRAARVIVSEVARLQRLSGERATAPTGRTAD